MQLQLWQHTNGDRYVVLLRDGVVEQAAGSLSDEQLRAAQMDEWTLRLRRDVGAWVQAHRGEFERVW